MKSPAELVAQLRKQWQNPKLRTNRLRASDAWPLELSIGKPPSSLIANDPEALQRHLHAWRGVRIGEVIWGKQRYRAAAEPAPVPLQWRIRKPSEWIQACDNRQIDADYARLQSLIAASDPPFHDLLIRQLPSLRALQADEIRRCLNIALQLEPGMAQGKPLRALAMGADTKFFERHRRLLTRLLDIRFDGAPGELGLETFLDAVSERDHWLLLAPLADGLLPYRQMRARASELQERPLAAGRILVVENEQCAHQLPQAADCIAVLGSGLDLGWMQASWLRDRQLAYWGDLDTWGLAMLGRARTHQPRLQALLMERGVFDAFADHAVAEPVPYDAGEPEGLETAELALFRHLRRQERGRLEQEYLPEEVVAEAVRAWLA